MKKTRIIIVLIITGVFNTSVFTQNKNIKEASICYNIEKLSSDEFLGRFLKWYKRPLIKVPE